jgi:membrane fusion protein, multidrug efflux system
VLSRRITVAIAVAAVLLGMLALYRANHYPRTDDAEVFANFIGIAPQVDGPIVRLNVHDNQFVRKGELLFEIDERPYQYALEKAVSEQAALEGQITDEQRRIAALVSAVSGSQAGMYTAPKPTQHDGQPLSIEARANVSNAEQGVNRDKGGMDLCG